MKDGINPKEFLKDLENKKHIVYCYDSRIHYEIKIYEDKRGKQIIQLRMEKPLRLYMDWKYEGDSIEECINTYLKEKIHDGKNFWEAEEDISLGYFEDKIIKEDVN